MVLAKAMSEILKSSWPWRMALNKVSPAAGFFGQDFTMMCE